MSTRRSKLEIMLTMLRAVREGVEKPTRIMYAANLAYFPTQRLLQSLVRQGLLNEKFDAGSGRSKKLYEITVKGCNALAYFEGASDLIDIENLSRSS
jgi:predicted transcriptional regulator